jgi:hypothetical protein
MNTYEAELRSKWNSIDYHTGGALKLSVEHPLEWHVRFVTMRQKSLVIVSRFPVDEIASSKSIDAACNKRKDGKYAISFTLIEPTQEDVFISMASDIIEYSKDAESEKAALLKVMRRYKQWLKLLDHKNSSLLGVNGQKGLIAELMYVKDSILYGIPQSTVVSGWIGPDGADQDFVFSDGWHEIKATGASSAFVTISSIEQLDTPLPGELVVYRIDKSAPTDPGAITLFKMVREIYLMLRQDTNISEQFFLKLAAAGYIDTADYDKIHFVVSNKTRYEIRDDFPKLSRAGLPPEIAEAEYQLDLPSIARFTV